MLFKQVVFCVKDEFIFINAINSLGEFHFSTTQDIKLKNLLKIPEIWTNKGPILSDDLFLEYLKRNNIKYIVKEGIDIPNKTLKLAYSEDVDTRKLGLNMIKQIIKNAKK